MVGVAILKDFETGSYEKIRLTFYEGYSFEDIDRAKDFISCTVNPKSRRITFDYGELKKKPTAREVFDICRRVREFRMENEYATIVRFAQSHGETRLKLVSEKLGVYGLPDKYALSGRKHTDVYKLLCDVGGRDILYISALCEALNFGVESLFDINYPMYFYASGGIYVNVFLCETCLGEKFSLPKELAVFRREAAKYYRALTRRRNSEFAESAQGSLHTGMDYDIITEYREYKCNVMKYIFEKCLGSKEFFMKLPEDSFVKKLTLRFYMNACDFMESFENYFYAKSHIRYITVNDLLALVPSSLYREQIIRKGRAASVNYKFQSRLPCPEYYDSHGKAYTRKG